jgi:SAM-dependent methyltransferase
LIELIDEKGEVDVLNKIKKLFMKNIDEGLEETSNQELEQIQPTADELAEIKDQGYLEDSAAIVGYATRQEQYNAYGEAIVVIPQGSSILDFGCGRGDFFSWHNITYNNIEFDYLGIDANQVLIDIGNKIYDNINLKCLDWNSLEEEDKKDWCINIRSNNLRYDTSTEISDVDYLKSTISKMYDMCNQGLIISLSSDKYDVPNQLSYNAGNILKWALKEYDNVVIDHTTDTNQFLLVIYKNN